MKKLKKLYLWMMEKSKHPKSVNFLCLFSFIESIFFPIPVDPFLIALGVAKPKKAFWYGFLTTFFSVLGGLIGYFIGAFLWNYLDHLVVDFIFSEDTLNKIFEKLQENGFWALFLSALTPLPFKAFALASGVFKLNLMVFLLGSLLGRGLRFMSLGLLFYFFGHSIRLGIEKYFEKILLISAILLTLFFILFSFIF